MNKKLFSLAFALIASASIAQEVDNVIDEVIWVVGDEAILRSEVEEERRRMLYSGEKLKGDPYGVIPEQMAIQKLFINQAIIDSISVEDSQVDAQVDSRINSMIASIGSKEKLEEYMEKPLSTIRSEYRTAIRNQMIVQEESRHLTSDVSVTPSEVRMYFERLPKDSIPFVPTQVEVQIISLQPRISQQTIDGIKARLRDYTQRVTSGESQFSTLAILYSEDTGSAPLGGELGLIPRMLTCLSSRLRLSS